MTRHHHTFAAIALLGAVVAGCAAETGTNKEPSIDPVLGGKADLAADLDVRGYISPYDPVSGTFEGSAVYHAYEFQLSERTVVDLKIMNNGTDEDLDTVMWLYGPAQGDPFGPKVQEDDDYYWDLRSRIRDVELRRGTYVVVVGTYRNDGLGTYRLLMRCPDAGSECAVVEPALPPISLTWRSAPDIEPGLEGLCEDCQVRLNARDVVAEDDAPLTIGRVEDRLVASHLDKSGISGVNAVERALTGLGAAPETAATLFELLNADAEGERFVVTRHVHEGSRRRVEQFIIFYEDVGVAYSLKLIESL